MGREEKRKHIWINTRVKIHLCSSNIWNPAGTTLCHYFPIGFTSLPISSPVHSLTHSMPRNVFSLPLLQYPHGYPPTHFFFVPLLADASSVSITKAAPPGSINFQYSHVKDHSTPFTYTVHYGVVINKVTFHRCLAGHGLVIKSREQHLVTGGEWFWI